MRIWISKTMAVNCRGNEISQTLIRVSPLWSSFNLLINSKEQPIGILEHAIILAKGEEWPKKSLRELGWKMLSKMDA